MTTMRANWIFYFILFVLSGVVGQFLFTRPGDQLSFGLGFFFLVLSVFFFARLTTGSSVEFFSQAPLSPAAQTGFLGLIAGLALFLGLYKIRVEPPGLFIDQGAMGLDALRLLRWHELPPLELNFLHHPPLAVYGLAAWFALFPATVPGLLIFFVALSWVGLFVFYKVLKNLGGPGLALVALAILTVMRWYFMAARNAFPSILVPLITFSFMYFFFKALRTRGWVYFALSGLFLGAGFYAYQALKVLPVLMVLLVIYELKMKNPGIQWKGLALMGGLFVILAAPVVLSWMDQGTLGVRESELWIGHEIIAQKSLAPLLKNLADFFLMFNHGKVPYPCMGNEGHRLLDDVTSFLLWIGFFYALRHWRNRVCFYSLAGFLTMSLPLILASDYLAAGRIVGAAPFAATLAALPVISILRAAKEKLGLFRKWIWAPIVLAFAFSVFQNYDVYFNQQADDPGSWRSFGSQATRAGEAVVSHPGVTYALDPCFTDHETVKFLCFDQAGRVEPLSLEKFLRPASPPAKKLCFVLDKGKKPTLELLKLVYSGGREEDLKDPWGDSMAYFYYWEPGAASQYRPMEKNGFIGRYFNSPDGSGVPGAVRWDPLLNFTNLCDFPLPGPLFFIQWKGTLNVSGKGRYVFSILSTDHGKLWIDGRQVLDSLAASRESIELSAGIHPIELSDERAQPGEIRSDFHLLWIPPGQAGFSVVPATAFGRVLTD